MNKKDNLEIDVSDFPGVFEFVRLGRPLRTPPAGWEEMPGGTHLGAGVWLLRYRRTQPEWPK